MRRFLVLFLCILWSGVALAEVPVERLEMRELWRRGTEDDAEVLLGNVGRILTDDAGNVYALDSQLSEVLVFSPEGEYLRSIGRSGEGPGEFNQGADVYYGLGGRVGVVQAFPGKIVQLTPDGVPLDNFEVPKTEGSGFQVFLRAEANPDRLVITGNRQGMEDGQAVQHAFLESFDPSGKPIAKFHESVSPFQWGGMKYVEADFVNFQRRWTLLPDGRVCAPLSYHDYRIHVWKPDGTVERVIEREDYAPVERTDEEKSVVGRLFEAVTSFNPNSTFEVSDRYPAIVQMFPGADGELWVLTARGSYRAPEGVALVFDVFDSDGVFARQVQIVGDLDPSQDAVYLCGDRLYVVTDSLGAAMNAMAAAGDGEEFGEVVPSNVVCYALEK